MGCHFPFLFAQSQSPQQYGGSRQLTIDFQRLTKEFRYDFEKFNPTYNPPNARICETVEMENRRLKGGANRRTMDFETWLLRSKEEMKQQRGLQQESVEIPVVVHVIYSRPEENISDEQIRSQIRVINEDYNRKNTDTLKTRAAYRRAAVSMNISFKLAARTPDNKPTNGIDRISMAGAPFSEQYITDVLRPSTIWDPKKYLNIWVCSIENEVLGFSQFPDAKALQGIPVETFDEKTDGIVINYKAFGTNGTVSAPFNKGRTLTHELGHWLGLRHVWGDGDCDADDYCADTPPTSGPNFGCKWGAQGCVSTAMIENFMDYSNDSCMNVFTKDQRDRVWTVLKNSPRRKELKESDAAQPFKNPPTPLFESGLPHILAGGSLQFWDKTQGQVGARKWVFQGADPKHSNAKNLNVSYKLGGTFAVMLREENSYGKDSLLIPAYVQVFDKGAALPFNLDFEAERGEYAKSKRCSFWGEPIWTDYLLTGGYGGSTGSLCALGYENPKMGARSVLLLPLLDFSQRPETRLDFDLAYANFDSKYTDTLTVYLSEDGGKTYHAIFHRYGRELSPKYTREAFYPKEDDWKTVRINLSEYDGKKQVFLAFMVSNGYGNNLFLDNIQVYANPPAPPLVTFEADKQQLCAGGQVQFEDLSQNQPNSWVWTFEGPETITETTQNPLVQFNLPGRYRVSLTAWNEAGEGSFVRDSFVYVLAKPVVQISGLPAHDVCPGLPLNLRASGAKNISWMYRGKLLNSPVLTDTIWENTHYTVKGTGSNGCVATETYPIYLLDEDKIDLQPKLAYLCEGKEIELTATGGKSYQWLEKSGIMRGKNRSIRVSPTQTSTFTVEIRSDNGCVYQKSAQLIVKKGVKLQLLEDELRLCPKAQLELHASGANFYFWNGTLGGASYTLTDHEAEMLQLVGLNTEGCADTLNMPVFHLPVVAPTLHPANPVLCGGQPTTIVADLPNGSIAWLDAEKKTLEAGEIHTLIADHSQDRVLAYQDEWGCRDSMPLHIPLKAKSRIGIEADRYLFCDNQAVQLSATGAVAYRWLLPDGSKVQAERITAVERGTYTCVGIDADGCESEAQTAALDEAKPLQIEADFSLDRPNRICEGELIQLYNKSKHGARFYWEFPGAVVEKSTDFSPKIKYDKSGSYTIFLYVWSCNGKDSTVIERNVVVVASPRLSLEAERTSICRGESVLISSSKQAIHYSWSPEESREEQLHVSPKTTTTYSLTVSNPSGCTAQESITITVVPAAESLSIYPPKPVVCRGDTLRLTTGNGHHVQWQIQGSVQTTENPELTFVPQNSTTVQVNALDKTGCAMQQSVQVEVVAHPRLTVAQKSVSICKGENLTLSASGADNYLWQSASQSQQYVGSSIVCQPQANTQYQVTGLFDNGCIDRAEIEVSVFDRKPLELVADQMHLCQGNIAKIAVAQKPKGTMVVWESEGKVMEKGKDFVSVAPSHTTTYFASLSGAPSCMEKTAITIQVHQTEAIAVKLSSPVACKGDSVRLSVNADYAIQWGKAVSGADMFKHEIYVKPKQTTLYELSAIDENNCVRKGSATVKVLSAATARLTEPITAHCGEGLLELKASPHAKASLWLDANNEPISRNHVLYVRDSDKEKTYSLVHTDLNGCKDTNTFNIRHSLIVPKVSILAREVDLATGAGFVQFEDKTPFANRWHWDFGDQTSSNQRDPKHFYSQIGTYRATLTVGNHFCEDTISQEIRISDKSNLSLLREGENLDLKKMAGGYLQIQANLPSDMRVFVQLVDAKGSVQHTQIVYMKGGQQSYLLDTSFLNPGAYTLVLADIHQNKVEMKLNW